jgi:hypothetical protein
MAIPCGSLVSAGLAVNLAVNRGDAELPNADTVWRATIRHAGGVGWPAATPAHPTRQHERTQVTRSLPAISECRHPVLCCAVLCCAVLCCAVLCCAVLCCAVLCCAVLCCAVQLLTSWLVGCCRAANDGVPCSAAASRWPPER